MNKIFTHKAAHGVQGLNPYQPGKPVEELEREYGISNIIKLASNENPLGPTPAFFDDAQDQLRDVARYPDDSGFELKSRLAAKHGVGMDQVTLGNGDKSKWYHAEGAAFGFGDGHGEIRKRNDEEIYRYKQGQLVGKNKNRPFFYGRLWDPAGQAPLVAGVE